MAKHDIKKVRGTIIPEAIAQKAEQAPSAFAESSLRERALLVRFSVGRWYGSGVDHEVGAEVKQRAEATGEVGSFSKRMMRRDRLAGINRVTAEARRYHKALTMPWGDSGTRLLGVEAFRDYKERMSRYEHSFNQEVEAFLLRYPEHIEEEKQVIGKLWKERDYPSVDALRERFRFGLVIEPLPDAADLRVALSKEQAEEIRGELERNMHASLVDAVKDIYARIAEKVTELRDKMNDPDLGLRKSVVEGLQEQLALVPKLNVLRDPNLERIAADIRRELCSIDIGAVKEAPKMRADVAKKADALLGVLGKMSSGMKYTQQNGEQA
jgi:hypothetical protein